jgi:hypothetical protein
MHGHGMQTISLLYKIVHDSVFLEKLRLHGCGAASNSHVHIAALKSDTCLSSFSMSRGCSLTSACIRLAFKTSTDPVDTSAHAALAPHPTTEQE